MNDNREFQKLFAVLMQSGDYQSAVEFARDCRLQNPRSKIIAENLGIALWLVGEECEACKLLENLCTKTRISTTAKIALVRCYVSVGKRRLAKQLLLDAFKQQDCKTTSLPVLASSLGRIGEYSLALEVCRELTIRTPSFPDAWYGIAYYQQAMGVGPQHLTSSLLQALMLEPRCLAVRMSLANAYMDLGKLQAAHNLVTNLNLDCVTQRPWLHLLVRIGSANNDRLLRHLADCKLRRIG